MPYKLDFFFWQTDLDVQETCGGHKIPGVQQGFWYSSTWHLLLHRTAKWIYEFCLQNIRNSLLCIYRSIYNVIWIFSSSCLTLVSEVSLFYHFQNKQLSPSPSDRQFTSCQGKRPPPYMPLNLPRSKHGVWCVRKSSKSGTNSYSCKKHKTRWGSHSVRVNDSFYNLAPWFFISDVNVFNNKNEAMPNYVECRKLWD